MPPQEIDLYVKLGEVTTTSTTMAELLLYRRDPDGTYTEVNGDLNVGRQGAQIKFHPHPQDPGITPWHFNECVVHPVGANTSRIDLTWYVQPTMVFIEDTGQVAATPRSFTYTLSVETDDSSFFGAVTKVYLDPKLVNTGGN